MADSDLPSDMEELRSEARAWIVRLRFGDATASDTAEMLRWRARSPHHASALSEAVRLHRLLLKTAQEPSLPTAEIPPVVAKAEIRSAPRPYLGRRAFLGSAMAASIGGFLVVRPPLGLWPSLAELRSDYRTGTGQRQTIALAKGVSVELNTRTSVALASDDHFDRLQLISGEVAVDASNPIRPVAIRTGGGEAVSNKGRFGVRLTDAGTCVTCLAGGVEVTTASAAKATLGPGQQLTFGHGPLGKVASVDPVKAEAWRRGLLIFTHEPLSEVVDEINRYRPGKIILANSQLSGIPVNAVFKLDRMDRALSQIREVADAREINLPGGLVVLS